MLLQMAEFNSFLCLSNISVCVCYILIQSSVDGHLGCIHVLAIINNAASVFLHIYPGIESWVIQDLYF